MSVRFRDKGKYCLVRTDPVSAFSDLLSDWSLITGRGATKWENRESETYCTPPPNTQDRVNFSRPPPLLKSQHFLRPPFNMAKNASYCVKTTPKLFAATIQHGLNFFRPPFRRGKTSHATPLPFSSPPPLPVISDQSLIREIPDHATFRGKGVSTGLV